MRRIAITLALLLPLAAAAQSDSTAIRIVERYLGIMNIDALPSDSMLVVNTQIIYPQTGDTLSMLRMYAPPQMFLVEVRDAKGKLQTGLCGDGKSHYRAFSTRSQWWRSITRESFFSRLGGFDVRGPLYTWRADNAYLTYVGQTTYRGAALDAVHYTAPAHFTRTYLFEPSGLLSAIIEEDTASEGFSALHDAHVDWKIYHEYDKVGPAVLPTLESFMREKTITIMRSEIHLERRDDNKFREKDGYTAEP